MNSIYTIHLCSKKTAIPMAMHGLQIYPISKEHVNKYIYLRQRLLLPFEHHKWKPMKTFVTMTAAILPFVFFFVKNYPRFQNFWYKTWTLFHSKNLSNKWYITESVQRVKRKCKNCIWITTKILVKKLYWPCPHCGFLLNKCNFQPLWSSQVTKIGKGVLLDRIIL